MKKHIMSINEEILEEFFKDMRSILYTKRPLKTQLKMLYAARNKASYMMSINNVIIRDHLQEKKNGH